MLGWLKRIFAIPTFDIGLFYYLFMHLKVFCIYLKSVAFVIFTVFGRAARRNYRIFRVHRIYGFYRLFGFLRIRLYNRFLNYCNCFTRFCRIDIRIRVMKVAIIVRKFFFYIAYLAARNIWPEYTGFRCGM